MMDEIHRLSSSVLRAFPLVQLDTSVTVVSPGEHLHLSLTSETTLPSAVPIRIEIVSVNGDVITSVTVHAPDCSTVVVVPDTLSEGRYELHASIEDLILDVVVLEVAEPEEVTRATSFEEGVKVRIQALDAVREGDYDRALQLHRQAISLLEKSESLDVIARAWYELGEAFREVEQGEKAVFALEHARAAYTSMRDPEGQATTLQLIGEVLALRDRQDDAREVFEAARSVADINGIEAISLGCRKSLWHIAGRERQESRKYYVDFISAAITCKSPAVRHQAISWCHEVERARTYFILVDDASELAGQSLLQTIVSTKALAAWRKSAIDYRVRLQGSKAPIPWSNLLEEFTSRLLTEILTSLSGFFIERTDLDIPLKVMTNRTAEFEICVVTLTREEPPVVLESLEEWRSRADYLFYEQLSSAVGASLRVNSVPNSSNGLVELRRPRNAFQLTGY